MAAQDPKVRTAVASIGGHARWLTADMDEERKAASRRILDRFEKQVDPTGELDPIERARRARHARSIYFKRLALKSAQARRRAREEAA